MRDKNFKNTTETTVAFALSIFLMNFLIIAVLGIMGWAIASVINGNSEFSIFLRGGFMS
ncbi:MAG TPA: hypothetical protein VNB22_00990 [Pyrinomonadaceae bacterium]|jgi:hypothetical protein|nr:hypothetical protein [Pyrinomonadaceae bacterium]